jgi:DNA polymerase III alpha subunit
MKLSLQPPQINHAATEFSVRYLEGQPALFMGLNQVRDLTRRTQAEIIRRRPYHTLAEFLTKVNPRPVEAENLVRCGCLRGLGTIPELLRELKDQRGRGGQLGLFSLPNEHIEDWSLAEKVTAQETLLGVGVDAHPLELYAEQLAAAGAVTTLEAISQPGKRIRVAGMRQTWRRSGAAGKSGFHMVLEDLEGMLDAFIPLSVYQRSITGRNTTGPFVIEGVVELDQNTSEPVIHAERIWTLQPTSL